MERRAKLPPSLITFYLIHFYLCCFMKRDVALCSWKHSSLLVGILPSRLHLNLIIPQVSHLQMASRWGLGLQRMHLEETYSVCNVLPSIAFFPKLAKTFWRNDYFQEWTEVITGDCGTAWDREQWFFKKIRIFSKTQNSQRFPWAWVVMVWVWNAGS